MKPLPPPDDAIDQPNSVEVIRGWIVGEDLQVSLAFEAFGNDPAIWGQLLAETVTHLADAMSTKGYGSRASIFAQIQASLAKHLERPEPGLHGAVRGPVQ